MSTTKKVTSLRLNKELYAHIEKIAKEHNRSVNNFIETILFDATGFSEEKMTKDAYKNMLIESNKSGRISLSPEEENKLFS